MSSHSGRGRSNSVIKIGDYALGATIGVGTFGKVKVAQHSITGHKVAVKILSRSKVRDLQMEKKLRREIAVLKLLHHPHVVRMYDLLETSADVFMVMEYVGGGELFDYIIRNGKLSEGEARRFFQQIICAVDYCHKHMVVHRDLKPENLLLTENGQLKLADFGLSNMMKDGEFLTTSCGSPNYAAPEVISGQFYAGPEVDVWSCGVILYALVTGRLPFDDKHIPTLFRMIREGKFSVPPFVSPECEDLIRRMIVVNLVDRATIADVCEHRWFREALPPYIDRLLGTPAGAECPDTLDEDVLARVYKLYRGELTRAQLRAALLEHLSPPSSDGAAALSDDDDEPPPLPGAPPPEDVPLNELAKRQVRVTYHLVSDSLRRVDYVEGRRAVAAEEMAPQSLRNDAPFDVEAAHGRGGGELHHVGQFVGVRLGPAAEAVPVSPLSALNANAATTTASHTSPAANMAHATNANNMSINVSSTTMKEREKDANGNASGNTTGLVVNMNMGMISPRRSSAGVGGSVGGVPKLEWYLGVVRSEAPGELMMELIAALKRLGAKWKVVDPFHLRVMMAGVKFDVQLFKIKRKRYLLDFKMHPDSHYIRFMDQCGQILALF